MAIVTLEVPQHHESSMAGKLLGDASDKPGLVGLPGPSLSWSCGPPQVGGFRHWKKLGIHGFFERDLGI